MIIFLSNPLSTTWGFGFGFFINTIETYYSFPPDDPNDPKPLIFFPIFLTNHFAIAILNVHLTPPTLTYYDSLLFGLNKIIPNPIPMTYQAKKYLNLITNLIAEYFIYKCEIPNSDYRLKHANTVNFFENIDELQLIQLDPLASFNTNNPPPFMPQQPNLTDCGVFTCAIAYLMAHNIPIPPQFTPNQLLNIRLRIKQLILSTDPNFPRDPPFTLPL